MRYVAGRYGQGVNASGKFETGSTLLGDLLIDTKELLRKVYFAIRRRPRKHKKSRAHSRWDWITTSTRIR